MLAARIAVFVYALAQCVITRLTNCDTHLFLNKKNAHFMTYHHFSNILLLRVAIWLRQSHGVSYAAYHIQIHCFIQVEFEM